MAEGREVAGRRDGQPTTPVDDRVEVAPRLLRAGCGVLADAGVDDVRVAAGRAGRPVRGRDDLPIARDPRTAAAGRRADDERSGRDTHASTDRAGDPGRMVETAGRVGQGAGLAVVGHDLPGQVTDATHVVILDDRHANAVALVLRADRPVRLDGGTGACHARLPRSLEADGRDRGQRGELGDAAGGKVDVGQRSARRRIADGPTQRRHVDPQPLECRCARLGPRRVELGADRPRRGEVADDRAIAVPRRAPDDAR